MIVVDSSVWIDFFRGIPTTATARLKRSTIDTLTATACIRSGYRLLHSDRDFDAFEQHLGLRTLR
ncbi:hypothetical protein BH11ACT5_BH11ACT5_05810 [soil metagenome]